MRNSFGFLVFFVCHLLIKTILCDDSNNSKDNQSLNRIYQQVQTELIETTTANSWPTQNRKYESSGSSNQFIESPVTTFNTSETALHNHQKDTNEHNNNSLNINGINFDFIPSFWNYIEDLKYSLYNDNTSAVESRHKKKNKKKKWQFIKKHLKKQYKKRFKKYKIKKKYKKMMVPLLLAYKLKFFTLIPVLTFGLILLVKSAGLVGFFFAMFASVMAFKKH